MQPLQVERAADQTPFAGSSLLTAERELSKAQDFLDDANDRFDRVLAGAIYGLANCGLELGGHLLLRAGIFTRRLRLLGKALLPALVMPTPPRRDVGINTTLLQRDGAGGADRKSTRLNSSH